MMDWTKPLRTYCENLTVGVFRLESTKLETTVVLPRVGIERRLNDSNHTMRHVVEPQALGAAERRYKTCKAAAERMAGQYRIWCNCRINAGAGVALP